MRKQWKLWQTLFLLGSKITADGDCSHEIKRFLLLGRKAMTNIDNILKSRGITLPTKVHLVKAMAFPVIMSGCESWTIKKAECWRINAFELWCWRRLLRVPWTARRSIQSNLKEISPEYSLEGLILKLKLQYFGHLMWKADSLEKSLMLGKKEGRRRMGQHRMRWLDGILASVQFSSVSQSCPTLCNPMKHSMPGLSVHHQHPESTQTHVHWVGDAMQPSHLNILYSVDMYLIKFQELVMDWEAWRAAVNGVTKSWTQLSNWTELWCLSYRQAGSLPLALPGKPF